MEIEKKDIVSTTMGQGKVAAVGNDFPAARHKNAVIGSPDEMRYSGVGPAIIVDLFGDDGEVTNPLYTFHAEDVSLVSKHVKEPWEM